MTPLGITRYQPCLLDRLADDQPNYKEEEGRSRVVSPQAYEASLRRDLEWLLNCNAHVPEINGELCPLFDYPYAVLSVINYGVRQAVGQSALDVHDVEKRLYHALSTYEPRINRGTLLVKARMEGNAMFCEIEAEYWADPVPLQQLIKTRVDLETGNAELLSGSGVKLKI
jgi:type VI secretion system protein ImpF